MILIGQYTTKLIDLFLLFYIFIQLIMTKHINLYKLIVCDSNITIKSTNVIVTLFMPID